MKDRIIGEKWDRFAALILPEGASKEQRDDVRVTFYSGVYIGIKQMMQMAKSDLTVEEKNEWMDVMIKEVHKALNVVDPETN